VNGVTSLRLTLWFWFRTVNVCQVKPVRLPHGALSASKLRIFAQTALFTITRL